MKALDTTGADIGGAAAERPIVTTYVYPPIPLRQFDWCAYRDGYEPPDSDGVGGGLVGWGRTKDEAIADLLEREAEDRA